MQQITNILVTHFSSLKDLQGSLFEWMPVYARNTRWCFRATCISARPSTPSPVSLSTKIWSPPCAKKQPPNLALFCWGRKRESQKLPLSLFWKVWGSLKLFKNTSKWCHYSRSFRFLPFDLRDLMNLMIGDCKPIGLKSTITQTVWTKCKTKTAPLNPHHHGHLNKFPTIFVQAFFQILQLHQLGVVDLEWFGHDWFDSLQDHFKMSTGCD